MSRKDIVHIPVQKVVQHCLMWKSHGYHTVHILKERLSTLVFLFFLGFFISVLQPFQEYFTYIEPIVHQRWAKTGEPGGKTT